MNYYVISDSGSLIIISYRHNSKATRYRYEVTKVRTWKRHVTLGLTRAICQTTELADIESMRQSNYFGRAHAYHKLHSP